MLPRLAELSHLAHRRQPSTMSLPPAGCKQGHWIWFVFPQLHGLGRSETVRLYGIVGLDEARAYLSHPVLAPRLDLGTRAVLANRGRPLRQIFGSPDDLKFHSSMTLFHLASSVPNQPFHEALDHWFGGSLDDASVKMIEAV